MRIVFPICVFKQFFFFNLIIFYVLFYLFINKVSVLRGIVHSVDMVRWVFKAYLDHFFLMTSNCILKKSCVGCISVFFEVFGLWYILWLFWRVYYMDDFIFSLPSCCIKNYLTTFLLSTHLRQYYFRYLIDEVLGIW